MPRFTVRQTLAAVAVSALILAGIKITFIDNRPGDLFLATLCSIDGQYTVYVKGFSESRFRSIRVGMAARQVEEILGPPLRVGQWQEPVEGQPTTPGEGPLHDLWMYTRAGKPRGDYWQREVWFKDGVVYTIERGFYVD